MKANPEHVRDNTRTFDNPSLSDTVPGRSQAPPPFQLKATPVNANFLCGSIGEGGENDPGDLSKLANHLAQHGVPKILTDELRDPAKLGKWVHRYQSEVLGWSGTDGRIDPGGKTSAAILDLRGRNVVEGWVRELYGRKNGKANEKEPQAAVKVGEDGWTIGPLLSKDQFFSQAHPTLLNGVNGIPRNVAFSGALEKYDRGGGEDIYNDAKVKAKWKKLSKTGREKKVYWRACYNTAAYMCKLGGSSASGSAGSLQTLIEEGNSRKPGKDFEKGVSRLDRQLEAGQPVLAGVDKGVKGLNANATDHYIVIVGRGQDESGKYYTYFDPGRTRAAGYDLTQNRLYVGKDKHGNAKERTVAGDNGYKKYTLSEVRKMTENK